jgi:hypothetical protein
MLWLRRSQPTAYSICDLPDKQPPGEDRSDLDAPTAQRTLRRMVCNARSTVPTFVCHCRPLCAPSARSVTILDASALRKACKPSRKHSPKPGSPPGRDIQWGMRLAQVRTG